MGIAERLFDGLRSTIEMRADIDRMTRQLEGISDDLLDHEKRLIRIETMIELGRSQSGSRRRLSDESAPD
jgi:hypothetical protein